MNRTFCILAPLLLSAVLPPSAGRAAEPDPELTKKALDVLTRNCSRCHGPDGSQEGGIDYILDPKQLTEHHKITPGNSAKSRLFNRVSHGDMPPEGEKPRPSKEDVALLKTWIDGGDPTAAPPVAEVKEEKRSFVSIGDNLQAMLAHQQRTDRDLRRYQRYFTFTNLYNNPAVAGQDLRLNEAALAKLLNSLSWKQAVVVPAPIDEQRTVFVVDIRKLDWDKENLWSEVIRAYPYGIQHLNYPNNKATQKAAEDLYDLAGTDLPAVRADWFIATASRPPLYHTLLQLPTNARDLERQLGVHVQRDFLNEEAARAGFTASGVSKHNRMVERHVSTYGAYWQSYDFKTDDGTANLIRFPLGPRFKDNHYNDQAFEQAGGEIIFNLPNGLQGYMLVNAKDERIDEGPTEVVRDKEETSGSVAVVNGLSCMYCHQHGMIKDFKDGVRGGSALRGDPLKKVEALYPEADAMQKLLDEDEDRFLNGLDRATGLFLKVGLDAKKDIKDFPEVIGPLARQYKNTEISLEKAAYELGVENPQTLKAAINNNNELAALGLMPLAQGNTLKRDFWESDKRLPTVFQEAARIVKRGTPARVRDDGH